MVFNHLIAAFGVTDENLAEAFGGFGEILEDFVQDVLDGNGGEGSFFGGLPDGAVTADESESGVPRPDGDGEIERADDTDWPEGEPIFLHGVVGAFGLDGEAVELAADTDSEVADVDHFLDFAAPLFDDLAAFEGDELAEVFLVFSEFVAKESNKLTASGSRNFAPGVEGGLGFGDDGFDFFGGVKSEGGEGGAIDGGGDGEVIALEFGKVGD